MHNDIQKSMNQQSPIELIENTKGGLKVFCDGGGFYLLFSSKKVLQKTIMDLVQLLEGNKMANIKPPYIYAVMNIGMNNRTFAQTIIELKKRFGEVWWENEQGWK